MAAKIKLQRIGAKSKPIYRIVVQDEGKPRSGRIIEEIGHYNPRIEPYLFEINKDKTLEWIKKGAKPTSIVRVLLGKSGILPPVSFEGKPKKAKKIKEEAKAAEAKKEEVKEEKK